MNDYTPHRKIRYVFGKGLLAGATSAFITKLIIYPYDIVNLTLIKEQIYSHLYENKKSKGIIDWFVKLIEKEGISSMWKGWSSALLRYIPNQALMFAWHEYYQYSLKRKEIEYNAYTLLMWNITYISNWIWLWIIRLLSWTFLGWQLSFLRKLSSSWVHLVESHRWMV